MKEKKENREIESFLVHSTQQLEKIEILYQQLVECFDVEYESVKQHRIDLLEEGTQIKIQLATEIETTLVEFKEKTKKFLSLRYKEAFQSVEIAELPTVIGFLFEDPGASLLLENFTQCIQSFVSYVAQIKPMMERNRWVLQALLQNHQQSYQFWLDVAKDTTTPYNQKGQITSTNALSQLQVKA
jgi:hypothetical protein